MEILLQATSYKDAGRTRKSKAEGRTFVVVVVQSLSHVWFFATAWTVARQSLLSMGFFRQEYWSGLPFPHPGDLPYPGIALASPASSCIGRRILLPPSHLESPTVACTAGRKCTRNHKEEENHFSPSCCLLLYQCPSMEASWHETLKNTFSDNHHPATHTQHTVECKGVGVESKEQMTVTLFVQCGEEIKLLLLLLLSQFSRVRLCATP